jgi:hypothetical protein
MDDVSIFEVSDNEAAETTYWEDAEEEEIEVEYRRGVTRQVNGSGRATAHCTRDGAELNLSFSREEGDEVLFFACSVCGRRARVEW